MNYSNVQDTDTQWKPPSAKQPPGQGPNLAAGAGDSWETYRPKSGSIQVVKGGMEYIQTAVGRDNWTCEIAAKEVAKAVCKHVDHWERLRSGVPPQVVKDHALKQIMFWEIWHDFVLTIEPDVKLRFTVNDYKFFYFGIGIEREID